MCKCDYCKKDKNEGIPMLSNGHHACSDCVTKFGWKKPLETMASTHSKLNRKNS